MKSERIGKHFVLAFATALVLYVVAYFGIEHIRNAKGPWRVTFKTNAEGRPSVGVSHEQMNLSNISVVFPEERLAQSNLTNVVLFDAPKTNVPFGQVLFLDTTFLPGTVAFDFFGHEVQFIPRGLFVNRKEIPWKSGLTISLSKQERILKPAKN